VIEHKRPVKLREEEEEVVGSPLTSGAGGPRVVLTMKQNGQTKESKQVGAAISRARLPASVVDWHFELDNDWSGYLCVRIWIILNDKVAGSPEFGDQILRIENSLVRAFERSGITRWPYVSFRSRSEQKELVAAGEK